MLLHLLHQAPQLCSHHPAVEGRFLVYPWEKVLGNDRVIAWVDHRKRVDEIVQGSKQISNSYDEASTEQLTSFERKMIHSKS